MSNIFKTTALAAVLAVTASAALAVPVGQTPVEPPLVANTELINPGEFTASFFGVAPDTNTSASFEAVSDLIVIPEISVTGTANALSGNDLDFLFISLTNPDGTTAEQQYVVDPNASTANGTTSFAPAGFRLNAGQSFSINFRYTDDGQNNIGNVISFNTAAVPIPASALLLLGALGGTAAVARRKAKKAA